MLRDLIMNHRPNVYYIMIAFVVLTLSFATVSVSASKTDQRVGIMTFNVENLFDTEHDEGKIDYTFLPLKEKNRSKKAVQYCKNIKIPKWRDECLYLDWNEGQLSLKMKNLAAAILQVNGGHGPDVLILEEVENKKVLEELVNKHLGKSGYKTVVLLEGKDERGIDVAVVSRLLTMSDPVLHEIPFQGMKPNETMDTRGILEVPLELPNHEKLTVYADHFPAPFHKKEYRVQAYQYLEKLMKEKNADELQIAGGDFNTPGDEDKKFDLLKQYVSPNWIIAHQVAYKGNQGSEYYPRKKTWSFLDMLLLSKNLERDSKSTWHWVPDTFVVADKAPGQLTPEGFPQSFDTHTGSGMSDHLPLYLEITR